MAYTLQLLHFADQEAGSDAIADAPNLSAVLNALRAQDLGDDGIEDNTLTLSSGDAFIPGLFFDSSQSAFGSGGIADIQIQNELEISAITLGNHEFDFGTQVLADLISGAAEGEILGADFIGANFAYLSANLDFATDPNLAPLAVAGGGAPLPNTVTSSIVLEEGGELIGVVGATTPTLATISSSGDLVISPAEFNGVPTPEQLDALAAVIQAEVDALLSANPGMNKVILSAHMQQLEIELGLAERLEHVDIIIGGGSNTRLTDENDRLRDGDVSQGTYPQFVTNAGGTETVVVNTDGSYKYVGRLVIEFDEDGNIIPESYDADVSGAFATDDQGVADLGAEGLVDPEIQSIVDQIEEVIIETESNVFGFSDVFLNAIRSGTGTTDNPDGVRTQETNLGNLTADANLAAAREYDDAVVVSIKNGGGIRSSIGENIAPAGGTEAIRSPNGEVVDGEGNVIKAEGGISQNDIQTSLAFNNNLTLLTLTRQELVDVLEHGLGGLPGASGRFPQISGVKMAFDETRPEGDRIINAAIVDENDSIIASLVSNGALVGDPNEPFRIVTLGFLADGGDGYPFPMGDAAERVDLDDLDGNGESDGRATGEATFAEDGTEQDALAEYLAANFGDPDNAFDGADDAVGNDARIVQLAQGGVNFSTVTDVRIEGSTVLFSGEDGVPDAGDDEGRAEIVAVENGRAYVTNDVDDVIDVFDIATGDLLASFDLTVIEDYAGVQSVAVKNGLIAAAVNRSPGEDADNEDGVIAFFDIEGTLLAEIEVGNLPDSVTFSPDGTRLAVANEGEPGEAADAPGTISIIDVTDGAENASVTNVGLAGFDGTEDALREQGIRIFPGNSASQDIEPEFTAFSEDGTKIYASLQENNAIAVIDAETGEIETVFSAGVQDLSEVAMDVNDEDGGFNPANFENVVSMRMPDSIAAFTANGTNYIVTANEGDARDEDARVQDFLNGEVSYDVDGDGTEETVTIDESVDTTDLERLEISAIDGDTDGDGDIDVLHAYGGRSFSIFDEAGTLIFDSGSDFGRITAALNAEGFVEGRSDNKGTEPEAVTIGEVDGRIYAFIGLERDSGIMVYDVTDPENSVFVEYFAPGDVGVSPEGMRFVSAEESPTGLAQLVVSYEFDGATVAYDLSFGLELDVPGTDGDDVLEGGFANDRILAGAGDDTVRGAGGNDTILAGAGDDVVAGNSGDDVVRGKSGDDTIKGGGGNDRLSGNGGNDFLNGGTGDDTLKGGGGDDVLIDGRGVDVLVGGAGDDSFVFVADGQIDRIRKFEDGADVIDISAWGVSDLNQLTITDVADDRVRITAGDEALVVNGEGLDAASLGADDFIFA